MKKEFWHIAFNEALERWIATSDDGRIMDAKHPGELLERLPRSAGQDKTAEFAIIITGR